MKVNDSKTNIMCVSAANSFEAKAILKLRNGSTINSVTSMKMLGCIIESDCGQAGNVALMCSKLRSRTWALPTLKKCGFTCLELVKIYCSMMRPTIEYCSPAWGSMLTGEQVMQIERQQVHALKHIFGTNLSGRELRRLAGIKSLEERRADAALKFALKSRENPRFRDWFKERPQPTRGRRASVGYRKYEEKQYKTDRYKNSPQNHLRRILNEYEQ